MCTQSERAIKSYGCMINHYHYTRKTITRLLPLALLHTHNNTDDNKLVIFFGTTMYYGDNHCFRCLVFTNVILDQHVLVGAAEYQVQYEKESRICHDNISAFASQMRKHSFINGVNCECSQSQWLFSDRVRIASLPGHSLVSHHYVGTNLGSIVPGCLCMWNKGLFRYN